MITQQLPESVETAVAALAANTGGSYGQGITNANAIDLCRPPYSCLPNLTDVTSAIQTALNLIAATGEAGEIYFSTPGTYLVNGTPQTGTWQSSTVVGALSGSQTFPQTVTTLSASPSSIGLGTAGQVTIPGVGNVTYTGTSGNTLTGCSGGTGTASSGTTVTQSYTYNGQILIPGTPYTSQPGIPITIRGNSRASGGIGPSSIGTGPGSSTGAPNGVVLQTNGPAGAWIVDTVPNESGFGYQWTGVMPIFKDVVFRSPTNPQNHGVNTLNCQRAAFEKVIVDCVEAWTQATYGTTAVALPRIFNNGDINFRGEIHGYSYAIQCAEHAVFPNVDIDNCGSAFVVDSAAGGSGNHAIYLGYVDTEEVGVIFDIRGCFAMFYGHIDHENGGTVPGLVPTMFAKLTNGATLAGDVALNMVYPARGGLGLQFDSNSSNHFNMSVQNLQEGMGPSGSLHPFDTFQRQGRALAAGCAPGMSWPTQHGWNVLAGTFQLNTSGQLSAATTTAQAFLPAKDTYGDSRTVSTTVAIGATYDVALSLQRVSFSYSLWVRAHSGNVTYGVGTVGNGTIGTITGAVTASSTITLACSIHYQNGLPYSVRIYLNGTLIASTILTAAQITALTPNVTGGDNPYVRDGLWVNDTTSLFTQFFVQPLDLAPNLNLGTATLAAGTVAIADTNITASSIIRLSRQTAGGTLGQLSVALTAGTGFTINSSSNTETSTVFWEVVSY